MRSLSGYISAASHQTLNISFNPPCASYSSSSYIIYHICHILYIQHIWYIHTLLLLLIYFCKHSFASPISDMSWQKKVIFGDRQNFPCPLQSLCWPSLILIQVLFFMSPTSDVFLFWLKCKPWWILNVPTFECVMSWTYLNDIRFAVIHHICRHMPQMCGTPWAEMVVYDAMNR